MDRLLSKPPSSRGKMVKIMNNEIVDKLNLDLVLSCQDSASSENYG